MWVKCSGRPLSPDELVTALSFGFAESGLDARGVFEICRNPLTLDRRLNVVRSAQLCVGAFLERTRFVTTEAQYVTTFLAAPSGTSVLLTRLLTII